MASRASASLPVLFAAVSGWGILPVWVGVMAGGYAAGSLEAVPRNARRTAIADQPHAVAVPLVWKGPAILRITGWPTSGRGDLWRSPARIVRLGDGELTMGMRGPLRGHGVLIRGKGEAPTPGTLIAGMLELSPPSAASIPGGFDYRLFLAGRGLAWRGSLVHWDPLAVSDPAARLGRRLLEPLRSGLVDRINHHLPPAEAGMAGAVLLGIRNVDTRKSSRPFADLGLAHLFAVSGLHVGILLGIVLLPAKLGGFPQWGKVAPLVVLLPIYVLLTGIPGSVVRAASLGFLALLAGSLGKPAEPLRLIGLLFWAGTIWDPAQVLDTGLKLSYLAAGGILAVSSLTNGLNFPTNRLVRPLLTGLAVSAAAQWFTFPLVAGSFGRISLLSPLANLVAVPLFGAAVWFVVLSLVLGDIWSFGAEAVAAWAWFLFRSMAGMAGYVSSSSAGFPLGLPAPGVGRILFWALLSGLGLVTMYRYSRGRIPGRSLAAVVILLIGTGLTVFGPLNWSLRPRPG